MGEGQRQCLSVWALVERLELWCQGLRLRRESHGACLFVKKKHRIVGLVKYFCRLACIYFRLLQILKEFFSSSMSPFCTMTLSGSRCAECDLYQSKTRHQWRVLLYRPESHPGNLSNLSVSHSFLNKSRKKKCEMMRNVRFPLESQPSEQGLSDGFPYYVNGTNGNMLIRYYPEGRKWLVAGSEHKGNNCIAYAEAQETPHPGFAAL